MEEQDTIIITRCWINAVVIGLNLCPFARRVYEGELIRYAVTDVRDENVLLDVLRGELIALAATPRLAVETTLLIHPNALTNFLDYNDFLAIADQMLVQLGLRGIIQIASFHPDYRFAGTEANDAANYTNRSPFPMLHLLREESVTEVAADPEFLRGIPERNIAVLKYLGEKEMRRLLKDVTGT